MMAQGAFVVFALLAVSAQASADQMSPVGKVLSMIDEMETKLIKEGEEEQKIYNEFSEYCEDTSRELQYEIKSATAEVDELKATIEKETATMTSLATEIDELAASVAEDEKELADGTAIRKSEAADFAAEEKELSETMASLQRAIGVMEKDAKAGAAFVQIKGAEGFAKALSAVISASSLSASDGAKLTALVQSSTQEDDDDEEVDAQSTAGQSKDEGIVELLENLLEKASTKLSDLRKKEESAVSNFKMTEQSLKQEIGYASHNLETAKKDSSASAEAKAAAEGDLSMSSKDLAADTKALDELHTECMMKANDFEAETKSRGEELKALATAKKIIQEATGVDSLAQVSFLQVVTQKKSTAHAAVSYMKRLAKKQHSTALAQLASRMASAVRLGASSQDVFAKLKTMIDGMIAKLEKEAQEEATKKAYCDKEMSETKAKKDDKSAGVQKLTTKIDADSASSTKVKEEVASTQSQLAQLASEQAELDKIRAEEAALYELSKAEQEKGLAGIRAALKVLKDYYSKVSGDAGSGIISMLEYAEADLNKGLSEMIEIEKMAKIEHKKISDEHKMTKMEKDKDVEYKTKESASLDKTLTEAKSDRESEQTELDAVNEYWAKIQEECVAKPEPYEEIKKRREEEIAGLKDGLAVLEGETALIQKHVQRRTLRGVY
eukprot:gnl/TRDRNA2_/TRDRNA2_177898_c0_seq1.p1 gnl/TRDRNA2_/TRDRNA2_177898_c0~~gnl/TRDRNA2_/TRDRNA2_177898_c0_seq1.p1  ORF type:complete len:701 (-),score=242.16 gnl/TRDRNA2_/TRDRNA2_177898_c0_seq1:124-2130(-)